MKIRNGFVSNSSSSSFIIDIPNEDLPLTKVAEFYRFREDLDEVTKGLMTFLIWRVVTEIKRREAMGDADYDYDFGYVDLGDNVGEDADITDDFIESCEWSSKNDYYKKEGYSEKYTENVRAMQKNGLKKFRVEVDNNSWDDGGFKVLPSRDKTRLDEYSEWIFDKEADEIHAIGSNQH